LRKRPDVSFQTLEFRTRVDPPAAYANVLKKFRRSAAALCAALLLLTAVSPAALAEGDVLDVLVIGVDTRSLEEPGRSDAMMLLRIDRQTGDLRLASFLRDLYVSIPGYGKSRLNAAYFYGGEELLKKTLKQNFGIEADRTATVHYPVLAELVDQLDGVELEVTSKELPYLNSLLADYGLSPLKEAGLQRLNGTQALCYSRIRKLDSDFQRTSRQQAVIAAMLDRLKGKSKWELIRLALQNLDLVQTDMTFTDILSLAPLAAKLGEMDIQTAHVPFEGAYREETVSGMMVLMPDLKQCRTQLYSFLD